MDAVIRKFSSGTFKGVADFLRDLDTIPDAHVVGVCASESGVIIAIAHGRKRHTITMKDGIISSRTCLNTGKMVDATVLHARHVRRQWLG